MMMVAVLAVVVEARVRNWFGGGTGGRVCVWGGQAEEDGGYNTTIIRSTMMLYAFTSQLACKPV